MPKSIILLLRPLKRNIVPLHFLVKIRPALGERKPPPRQAIYLVLKFNM